MEKTTIGYKDLNALIDQNQRISVRKLASEFEMYRRNISQNLKEIETLRKLERSVPHEMSEIKRKKQKNNFYLSCDFC